MSNLYRKSALEKLSSPEQLDRMIVITPPSVWVAIVAGLILLVAGIVWGTTGEIPVLIACEGEFYDKVGFIESVYSEVDGIVRECYVELEDNVKKGDVLMVVEDEQGVRHKIKAEKDAAVYTILAEEGSFLGKGQKAMQIRELYEEGDDMVHCYVKLNDARKIEKGMEVMVYPNNLNTKEYGHIKGEVVEVSRFVLNRNELEKYIGSEEKISQMLSGEYLVGVHCQLEKDPESVNGYKWSNDKGKEIELLSGITVTAEVVVANATPISMLFQ